METPQAFVGIDVAKNHLDVYIHPGGASFRVDLGKDPAMETLMAAIAREQEGGAVIERVVMESSGGYEAPCVAALAAAGLPVVVANARQVRDFAKATGRLAKTDRVDAKMIALFADKIRPQVRALASQEERELREMMTRRRQLIDEAVSEECRLETLVSAAVRHSVERHALYIRAEIARIEEALRELIRASPAWSGRADLLRSAKGVGEVTAHTLLACLPELGRLDRKKIASFTGLAPWSNDSGERQGRRSIWGGRATVRSALYMATLSAICHNNTIKGMYKRLLAKGKVKKVALIACARKLLTILNAMVRDNTPFQEQKTHGFA